MKKACVILVLVGLVGSVSIWENSRMPNGLMSFSEVIARAEAPQDEPARAPEFPKDIRWVQSDPLKLGDLHGKVVVVHFWTFGCINCIHNYSVYKDWQKKYADKSVTMIGVHTPEFANEMNVDRVKSKAKENDLKFPIAIDNDQIIWKAWNNQYWPSIYLVDKQGKIRHRWEGELNLDTVEGRRFAARIDELLAEPSENERKK